MVSEVIIITCISNFVKGKMDLEEGEIEPRKEGGILTFQASFT